MSVIEVYAHFSFKGTRGLIAFLSLGCLLVSAQPGRAQSLNLFKNYFVTGDYTVAGKGMRGTGVLDSETGEKWATATINMTGVPENADILAAFLYWVALESSSTPFSANGFFRGFPIVGLNLPPDGTPGCWGSGGGSGTTSGASPLRVYRANVLPYLPFPKVNGVPTGKRQANGSHQVRLRDSGGGGNQVPQSGNQTNLIEGASLVVVWRRPDYPLRSVVIYDGAYTASQDNLGAMTQEVKGFYQAASGAGARMTHLVSNGNTNFQEKLTVNGSVPTGVSATNPFARAQGFSWDNLTFDVNIAANASSVTTAVEALGSSVDCLSWGAIIFSTKVQDSDWDGLLDVWEEQGLKDLETDSVLVNLPGMGANKNVQDIFIQVGYLKTTAQTTYGNEIPAITAPQHSHLPAKAVFDQIAALFETAGPRKNPAGNPSENCSNLSSPDCISGAIKVHFDVGSAYQGNCSPPFVCSSSPYVPAAHAQGGQFRLEADVVSSQFPLWPGTVGWKGGFLDIWADLGFDPNRRHIFRRALFAHAFAIQDPTKVAGTPRSVSGVADAGNGGGDFMVTLGLWDNFTASQFVQTSTTVHEIAHMLGIRHGGVAPTPTIPSLNCKPNYQSISNYLFQILGLPGPSGPVIDLSRQVLQSLNESTLSETALKAIDGITPMTYATRWYVPLNQSVLNTTLQTTAASKTCTGAPVAAPEMVRVSGTSNTASIDWDLDGNVGETVSQDVNYNKTPPVFDSVLGGFNDWLNLDLRQGATKRNWGPSIFVNNVEVPVTLSLEIEKDNLASGDPGFGDPGFGDPGFGDPGFGDPGFGDPGFGDPGFGDPGFGDPGFGGDLDFERATDLGGAPYNLHIVTVTNQAIILGWSAPTAGNVSQYRIWRAEGQITNNNQPTQIGSTNGNTLTFSDTSSKNNVVYAYIVTAVVQGKNSGPSNTLFPAKR